MKLSVRGPNLHPWVAGNLHHKPGIIHNTVATGVCNQRLSCCWAHAARLNTFKVQRYECVSVSRCGANQVSQELKVWLQTEIHQW